MRLAVLAGHAAKQAVVYNSDWSVEEARAPRTGALLNAAGQPGCSEFLWQAWCCSSCTVLGRQGTQRHQCREELASGGARARAGGSGGARERGSVRAPPRRAPQRACRWGSVPWRAGRAWVSACCEEASRAAGLRRLGVVCAAPAPARECIASFYDSWTSCVGTSLTCTLSILRRRCQAAPEGGGGGSLFNLRAWGAGVVSGLKLGPGEVERSAPAEPSEDATDAPAAPAPAPGEASSWDEWQTVRATTRFARHAANSKFTQCAGRGGATFF